MTHPLSMLTTPKIEGASYWVGNYGDYLIPAHLKDVKTTKSGAPDKRYRADYARMMAWVAEMEEKQRKELESDVE